MIVCCGKSFGIPRSLTTLTHTLKKNIFKKNMAADQISFRCGSAHAFE